MAKIVFIQEELRARFGIMTLAAVLKQAKHKCEVFIYEKDNDLVNEVIKSKPDIIAFSTMTPGIDFALRYANLLKKSPGTFIIMGGPHPTFYPEVLKEKCLDAICIGEGEFALLELANAIDQKTDFTGIKNLWIKKGSDIFKNELRDLVDINNLPVMDREIYYDKYAELRNEPTKKFFVVRGCPFSCSYCFNHVLKQMYSNKGKYVRLPDIDKLINEIKSVRGKYGMRWVQLNADTFNVDKKWSMDFLERYKNEIGMPFLCNVRIDRVDEELVKKLKEANCNRVDFAIESGDENILNNVLKRNMSTDKIIEAGKLFRKYNIRVITSNIIGSPHETVETAMKTIRVNREVSPELANCFTLQPYPKTEIYRYAIEQGFLENTYAFSKEGTGFQIGFEGVMDSMPIKLKQTRQLKNLVSFFDLLVQHPYLEPIIRILINLPPNRFFYLVKVFPLLKQDAKYSKSFKRRLKIAKRALRILLFNK